MRPQPSPQATPRVPQVTPKREGVIAVPRKTPVRPDVVTPVRVEMPSRVDTPTRIEPRQTPSRVERTEPRIETPSRSMLQSSTHAPSTHAPSIHAPSTHAPSGRDNIDLSTDEIMRAFDAATLGAVEEARTRARMQQTTPTRTVERPKPATPTHVVEQPNPATPTHVVEPARSDPTKLGPMVHSNVKATITKAEPPPVAPPPVAPIADTRAGLATASASSSVQKKPKQRTIVTPALFGVSKESDAKYANVIKQAVTPSRTGVQLDSNEVVSQLSGYVEVPERLWTMIPVGAQIRFFKRGSQAREQRYRPGGYVKSHNIAGGQTVMLLETTTVRDDPDYYTYPVALADCAEVWKKPPRDAYIELVMMTERVLALEKEVAYMRRR